MVSTRGVRYKFSEGERVLCYEPDPTKAKVLYDSKVLEVIESKDKRGRRTVEYLIHFQGWNSSWDRCVSEDFVLKDTEENRQLQRDLAEKSQLQLGAYLYRRERKKGGSATTGAGPAKRPRHGFSDDGSSSSTQPDPDEGETGDTDSSSASCSASSQPRSPPPNLQVGRAHIVLPSALRDRLTFDYHLVVKRGRLSRLPATPCAAQILESFVKWFARAGAWQSSRARHDPPQKPDLLDVSCRLNLVREVADGLRVYFDFILRGHLLYKQELNQYHMICGKFIETREENNRIELEQETEETMQYSGEEGPDTAMDVDQKSPKTPEYSHLPPDPTDRERIENNEDITNNNDNGICNGNDDMLKTDSNDTTTIKIEVDENDVDESERSTIENDASESGKSIVDENHTDDSGKSIVDENHTGESGKSIVDENHTGESSKAFVDENHTGSDKVTVDESHTNGTGKSQEDVTSTISGNVARRLRSHRSVVSQQSESEEPGPSTSTGEPRTFETHSSRHTICSSVGSSGSSVSEGWTRPQPAPAAPATTRTPLSLLLDKVSKWQIIPREGTEHLPCRVYGAIHLARLFVRLPDFLNATQIPDFKLKLILKHIDMFIQYLDEHSEWFGEMYYVADNTSRSH